MNKKYRIGNLWLCNYCNDLTICTYFTTIDDYGYSERHYCCCKNTDCMRKFIADKNKLKGKEYRLQKI